MAFWTLQVPYHGALGNSPAWPSLPARTLPITANIGSPAAAQSRRPREVHFCWQVTDERSPISGRAVWQATANILAAVLRPVLREALMCRYSLA